MTRNEFIALILVIIAAFPLFLTAIGFSFLDQFSKDDDV